MNIDEDEKIDAANMFEDIYKENKDTRKGSLEVGKSDIAASNSPHRAKFSSP